MIVACAQSAVERTSLHRDVVVSCTFFPILDLFFIFNLLHAVCVGVTAPEARASRQEKPRSNTRLECMVCFIMKKAPYIVGARFIAPKSAEHQYEVGKKGTGYLPGVPP